MTWKRFANVMLVTMGLVLLIGLNSALAETAPNVYVDDDWTQGTCPPQYNWHWDAFNNIQEGIDSVVTGGTVHVFDGVYTENILINKSLTLAREGAGTVTVKSADNTCYDYTAHTGATIIDVTANDVTIADITIDGTLSASCSPPNRAMAKTGINTETSSVDNLTVSGCEVMNCVRCIKYNSSTNGSFHNNTVHDFGVGDLSRGVGIYLWGSTTASATVSGNTVYDGGGIGIAFHQASSGTIRGNLVDNCLLGILNNGNAGTATIDSNTVTDCDQGIQSWAINATAYVTDNEVTGCTWAVTIYREGGSYYNYITGNTIDGDTTSAKGKGLTYSSGELALVPHSAGTKAGGAGLFISTDGGGWGNGDVHAIVRNNYITGNDYGIYLHEPSGDLTHKLYVTIGNSTAYSNYIYGNSTYECYVENADDNDVNARYNWWDYNGVDPEPVIYHYTDDNSLLRVYFSPWLKSNVAVIPPADSVDVGNTVPVDIFYNDFGYPQHPALMAYEIDVNFDPDSVEFVSATQGGFQPWIFFSVDSISPGVRRISGASETASASTGSGALAQVTFKGIHPACKAKAILL